MANHNTPNCVKAQASQTASKRKTTKVTVAKTVTSEHTETISAGRTSTTKNKEKTNWPIQRDQHVMKRQQQKARIHNSEQSKGNHFAATRLS